VTWRDGVRYGWLTAAAVALAVTLVLTHVPQLELPGQTARWGVDKLIHAGAYGAVMLLTLRAMGRVATWPRMLAMAALLAVVGVVDEYTQPLMGRTASVYDWLADVAGLLLGMSIWRIARRHRPESHAAA
jgi:VanZ family protein